MASVNTTLYGKQGDEKFALNPTTLAVLVAINDETGAGSTVEAEIIKLRQAVNAVADAGVHFKGYLTSTSPLPSVAYKAGWQYAVKEAGTYAGNVCEVGDLVLCVKDYASGSASNADWIALQANLTGTVTGPASSVAAHVVIFDGTAGNKIKDSGFTIGKSVPPDAEFTDTTYAPATAKSDGLMTAAQFTKLAGVETGADKTDADNVSAAGAFMKDTDTADNINDGTSKVLMTPTEREKLSGISSGAEANQNAFSSVRVGEKTISATSKQDTLEISAGDGVTIEVDTAAKKVTISEMYIDSCVVSDLDSVPENLRDGGLVILKL